MGVPKFFRYVSERYPCLSQLVREEEIPEIDNLYLDMNGVIHVCSHPNDFDPHFRISEEDIFKAIFHYLEVLFNMIKPNKIFFMAVDGVAPRAKMNQQRGRRFRSAKEAEVLEKKAKDNGETLPEQARFDSNCITPGTVFMDRLHQQLKYFVSNKITNDPGWQKCTIILSGHETPGEGEHKIMDYIRYLKTQPNYDSNTRHCLYGLDADLIMLGLITHEPNFCLLREEVKYGKKQKRTLTPEETKFYLLHLSLFREYLNLEFEPLKNMISFEYDLESIIDDWVLMGFLVGNDFIPHLPDLHINKQGLEVLYSAYREVLPKLDGYLHENGYLNLPRFKKYLEKLAEFDTEKFEEVYADLQFLEEKGGRKEDGGKRSEELTKLIEETMEFCEEEKIEEEDSSEDDMFLQEFSQHKSDYYRNKLELEHVNDDVLNKQAEGYVQAIQWNLHYYYHGCQSWSWFYPHHYSPFVSDVANFKDVDLNFDMGKPFLPFHQLLAVLPPASKDLLPEAYRDLMMSKESPIIDFYPNDFATDLNGKNQEWEAVVLIPFIQEDRLLSAMEQCSDTLTEDEMRRNRHGPMSIYTYSPQGLGRYPGPDYFPEIPSNHALEKVLWPEDIIVDKEILEFGLRPGVNKDLYIPGFPSLRFIPHKASMKKKGVRVFDQPSRGLNMILEITNQGYPNVEEVAKGLLGHTIYVMWPHMVEAKVTKVVDNTARFSLVDGEIKLETISNPNFVNAAKNAVYTEYQERKGIIIGETNILVYASQLEGKRFVVQNGKVGLKKIWHNMDQPYALQTTLRDLNVMPPRHKIPETIEELFPINSNVFALANTYYGSMGKVLDNKSSKIFVELVYQSDLGLDKEKYLASMGEDDYMPGNVAVRRGQFNFQTFSKITSSVFLVDKFGKRYNIGLNLKSNKKNQEVPGYTKRDNSAWLYTTKTIQLVNRYRNQYPELFSYLDSSNEVDYSLEKIWPCSGRQKVEEIKVWLKNQEHNDVAPVECGSEFLPYKVVANLERDLEKVSIVESQITVKVSPNILYRGDLTIGTTPPAAQANFLLDRIISCRSSHSVPLGSRGFIIGIAKGPQPNDDMYIILFDKPFPGGLSLAGSSPNRAYRLSQSSFINISDGIRCLSKGHKPTAVLRPINSNKQPSAFAPVMPEVLKSKQTTPERFLAISKELQRGKVPLTTKLETSDYNKAQGLMEMLKIKPDPQTDALKKTLNIGQKKSVESQQSAALADALKMKSVKENNVAKLMGYYQKKSSGIPRYQSRTLSNGLIMADVVLPNEEIYHGLPCETKEAAYECAAFEALVALGIVQRKSDKKPSEPLPQPPHANEPLPQPPHPSPIPIPPLSWRNNSQASAPQQPGPSWRQEPPRNFFNPCFQRPMFPPPPQSLPQFPPQTPQNAYVVPPQNNAYIFSPYPSFSPEYMGPRPHDASIRVMGGPPAPFHVPISGPAPFNPPLVAPPLVPAYWLNQPGFGPNRVYQQQQTSNTNLTRPPASASFHPQQESFPSATPTNNHAVNNPATEQQKISESTFQNSPSDQNQSEIPKSSPNQMRQQRKSRIVANLNWTN